MYVLSGMLDQCMYVLLAMLAPVHVMCYLACWHQCMYVLSRDTSVCSMLSSNADTSVCNVLSGNAGTSVCNVLSSNAGTSACNVLSSNAGTSVCNVLSSNADTSVCSLYVDLAMLTPVCVVCYLAVWANLLTIRKA